MDEDCPYFIAHISESVCRTFCGCRAGFYTLAEQEVLRLVGKLSLFFFFLPCCSEFRGKAEEMHVKSSVFYLPLITHTHTYKQSLSTKMLWYLHITQTHTHLGGEAAAFPKI